MFYSEKFKSFKNIKHCFFSKNNGFSKGIYLSLNCGLGSKDDKINVIKNLKFVSNSMSVSSNNLILMNQTHSNKVTVINKKNKNSKQIDSDALITDLHDVAIGVLTADCVPIILYDKTNNVIGCIHAGWKGAISGIIKNTINKFKELNSVNEIFASVGPCIGKESYEVGEEFFQNFIKESNSNRRFFYAINNKFLFDIRGFINDKLHECGLTNVDNVEFDTYKDFNNFFSYRRSLRLRNVDYGRCISTICLKI
jgi:YfiH family protein